MTTRVLRQDPMQSLRSRLAENGTGCLRMAVETDMQTFPRFVMESTLPSFAGMPGRSKLLDQGGLELRRCRHLKCVHVSERAIQGASLARALNRNPHYDIEVTQVPSFLETVQSREIPLRTYKSSRSHLGSEDKDYRVINSGSPEFQSIDKLMDELHFEEIVTETMNNKLNAARGTYQTHVGFTCDVCLVMDSDGCYQPHFHGNCTDRWKERNVAMTKIAEILFDGIKGSSPAIFGDTERNKQFASSERAFGDVRCRIEAQTGSLQSEFHPVAIHVDVPNDGTALGVAYNYDYVVCAWRCFTVDGVVYRATILGYSRSSVSHSIQRRNAYERFWEERLQPWFSALPESRKIITADLFLDSYGEPSVDLDGNVARSPNMNKCVHYSGYGDMLLEVVSYFRESNVHLGMDRFCELLLPVAFSPSPEIYRDVLMGWIKTGFPGPKENWTVAFVETALRKFPSLSATHHRRHQPSFNSDKDRAWVYSALKILLFTLVHARSTKCKSPPTYAYLVKMLTTIVGIGDLLAQQLIAVAALVGAIPTSYATQAMTCRETKTALRLKENGFDCATMCQSLLSFVTSASGMNTAYVENCTCEFGRLPNHPFVDVVYANQKRILFVDATLSLSSFPEHVYNVSELLRSCPASRFSRHKLCLPAHHDPIALRYEWWAYSPNEVETHPTDGSLLVRVVNEEQRGNNAKSKDLRNNRRASKRVRLQGRGIRNRTPFGIPQHLLHQPQTKGTASLSANDGDLARCQMLFELLEDDSSVTSHWEREDRAAERSEGMDELKDACRSVVVDAEHSNRQESRHLRDMHRFGKMRKGTLRDSSAKINDKSQGLFPTDTVLMGVIDRPVLLVSLEEMARAAVGVAHSSGLVVEVTMVTPVRFTATARYNGKTIIQRGRRFALKDHLVSDRSNSNVEGAVCHYTTQKAAKKAMYFYLFTKLGDPRLWLSQMLHRDDWFSFTAASESCHAPSNSKQFVVLSVNGSHGATFAVLCRDSNVIHMNLLPAQTVAHRGATADKFAQRGTAFRLCDCPYIRAGEFKIRKKRKLPSFTLPTASGDCAAEPATAPKQRAIRESGWNVVRRSNTQPDFDDARGSTDLPQAARKYWPDGWEKITRIRGTGDGGCYHSWMSPLRRKELRSKVTLRKFLDELMACDGDEDIAYDRVFGSRGKKTGKRNR